MNIKGNTIISKIIFPFIILLVSLPSNGQNGNSQIKNKYPDTSDLKISSLIDLQTSYIRNYYYDKIEVPNEFINGKEYESYFSRSKVKPLLFFDKTRTASIITNSRIYNDITLQYDTYLDEVIYTDTSRSFHYIFPQIALNTDIINGFNLYFQDDTLAFRYFRDPECSEENLKEGFYEVVYEANSRYIIKHESNFYVREGLNNYKYSPKNYISVGNKFSKINTRKNLLGLLEEKPDEVKEFLHSSGIKVRKADKGDIISIIKYYDSLVKSDR